MKIIIEHKGVKREISGSGFNVCGSKEDLRLIADQLVKGSEHGQYGWIQIRVPTLDEHQSPPGRSIKEWCSNDPAPTGHPDQVENPAAGPVLNFTRICMECGHQSKWVAHKPENLRVYCWPCKKNTEHKFTEDPS